MAYCRVAFGGRVADYLAIPFSIIVIGVSRVSCHARLKSYDRPLPSLYNQAISSGVGKESIQSMSPSLRCQNSRMESGMVGGEGSVGLTIRTAATAAMDLRNSLLFIVSL